MADEVDVFNIAEGFVKNLLRNTIETYPPEWRLVQEPLQNAIDSFLDDKGSPIEMKGETPKVTLELFIGSNVVRITDNGRGIPLEGFKNFLILGNGTKGSISESDFKKMLKGSQGVGIKSTVFTSKRFIVDTVSDGVGWSLNLDNYCDYKSRNFSGIVQAPSTVQTMKHSGTSITIQLDNYSVWNFITDRVDDFFKTIGVNDEDITENEILVDAKPMNHFDLRRILLRYFKKDSYVGCVTRRVSSDTKLPDVEFELRIICDFLQCDQDQYVIPGVKKLEAGETYSIEDEVGYLDYSAEINKLNQKQRPKVISDYRDLLEIGSVSETLTVFYQCLSKQDVIALCGNLRKRKESDPPSVHNYILDDFKMNKHKTALERVNGAILFIAPRPFLKNPFAHRSMIGLSVNGLPTDITLDISGGELGYVPSVHLILDVDETLGYGKRNLHPRSKGIYNDLAKTLWINLRKLSKLIVGTTDSDTDKSITGIRFQPEVENSKILDSAKKAHYYRITGRITEPETEEDLIAAYFHMVGKGYLKGYRWMRLNDSTIYDGYAQLPEGSNPFNIEFKYDSKSLCERDSSGDQMFRDITIAIVWKLTSNEELLPGYNFLYRDQDISFSKNYYPDVNCRIRHDRDYVQVIALKDIVEDMIQEDDSWN